MSCRIVLTGDAAYAAAELSCARQPDDDEHDDDDDDDHPRDDEEDLALPVASYKECWNVTIYVHVIRHFRISLKLNFSCASKMQMKTEQWTDEPVAADRVAS